MGEAPVKMESGTMVKGYLLNMKRMVHGAIEAHSHPRRAASGYGFTQWSYLAATSQVKREEELDRESADTEKLIAKTEMMLEKLNKKTNRKKRK